jgi:hypothetical protein
MGGSKVSDVSSALTKMLEIIKIDEDIADLRCDINRIRDFKLNIHTSGKLNKIKELTMRRAKMKHAIKVIIRRIDASGVI